VDIPELTAEAIKMARSLDWHGLVKMDFVYDPVAKLYRFIEIDPRVSASIDITRAAGADQCVMLADLVEGRKVEAVLHAKAGVTYRWLFPRDLLVAAARPGLIARILPDVLSPRVHFDLGLDDPRVLALQTGRFLKEKRYRDPTIGQKARHAVELEAAYRQTLAS
jgi:hypothetical protein